MPPPPGLPEPEPSDFRRNPKPKRARNADAEAQPAPERQCLRCLTAAAQVRDWRDPRSVVPQRSIHTLALSQTRLSARQNTSPPASEIFVSADARLASGSVLIAALSFAPARAIPMATTRPSAGVRLRGLLPMCMRRFRRRTRQSWRSHPSSRRRSPGTSGTRLPGHSAAIDG
jgi:hypothetical protein